MFSGTTASVRQRWFFTFGFRGLVWGLEAEDDFEGFPAWVTFGIFGQHFLDGETALLRGVLMKTGGVGVRVKVVGVEGRLLLGWAVVPIHPVISRFVLGRGKGGEVGRWWFRRVFEVVRRGRGGVWGLGLLRGG